MICRTFIRGTSTDKDSGPFRETGRGGYDQRNTSQIAGTRVYRLHSLSETAGTSFTKQ